MDRLEEIKKKDWQLNNHIFPVHSNKQLCKRDIVWLISEIERLKKEKEWLAEELIELYERYTTTDMPTEEMKKMLFEEMQQALKEE